MLSATHSYPRSGRNFRRLHCVLKATIIFLVLKYNLTTDDRTRDSKTKHALSSIVGGLTNIKREIHFKKYKFYGTLIINNYIKEM